MTAALLKEWEGILARRRRHGTCGQDGSDFALFCKFRGITPDPVQLELFA